MNSILDIPMSQAAIAVVFAIAIGTGAYLSGYSQGVDDTKGQTVDVDLMERSTPAGSIQFECSEGRCDVTVSVDEWNDYESLAVQDVTGTFAETYYLNPNDETLTIEDVPKQPNHRDEIALYVPVRTFGGEWSHVWGEYYDEIDGSEQSFSGIVERNYTVPITGDL